jgi:hypothetical protein
VVAGYCDLPVGPDTLEGVHRLIDELPASESVARAVLLNMAAFYAHSLGGMLTALDLTNRGIRAIGLLPPGLPVMLPAESNVDYAYTAHVQMVVRAA